MAALLGRDDWETKSSCLVGHFLMLGLISLSALSALSGAELPRLPDPLPFHFETVSNSDYSVRWVSSPVSTVTGTWAVQETAEPRGIEGERMIFAEGVPGFFGLSTEFDVPLNVTNKTVVLQYETRATQEVICAGSYIKLFGEDNFSPTTLCNETRSLIMFGRDKCGN
jgi:hypothetical protein